MAEASERVLEQRLEGQVILVTGAARRIGRAIALRLAENGAQVAVHYGRSKADAAQTTNECGGKAFQADLSRVSAIQRLFADVHSAYGQLDGLVNNAAIYREMKILEVTEDDWDSIHSINLKSVFFCSQAAAKLMLSSGGGKIVNISSLGGLRPWTRHALLRLESRRHHADESAGESARARDIGQQRRPGGDPL